MKLTKCTGAVTYTVTPYCASGTVDEIALRKYLTFIADEGAKTVVLPTIQGDIDYLRFEERTAMVKTAAETVGNRMMVMATVVPSAQSAGEQAHAYLEAGADAINLRYPTDDVERFRAAFDEIVQAGAEYIAITDSKSGGFDMNMMKKGPRPPSGLPEALIVDLFRQNPAFKSLIVALPLNECGPKTSRLLAATEGKLNIIAETATDQFLEHLDRGVEGFVTGCFVRVFQQICSLYDQVGFEAARPLFFAFLRVIVWTKQYVDREPYLYQRYLVDKGIFSMVSFRTPRYIDTYMGRYGSEMLTLAKTLETSCPANH